MISVIICSKDNSLYEEIKKNIDQTIGVPHEVIKISNPKGDFGICEAYNKGADLSKYETLCFCHEDLLFETQNWGDLLLKHFTSPTTSLVGILGNLVKTKFPSGVYSSVQSTNRINQVQKNKDGSIVHYYNNPNNEYESEVACLDGMFLATKKSYWKKYPFDEQILKRFHGYDIDFSLSMNQLGRVVVVYDILIKHFSSGGNTKDWVESQFAISKKWESDLPIIKGNVTPKIITEREVDDIIQYILTLRKLEMPKSSIFHYGKKLLFKKPFHRFNLSVLKMLAIRLKK